MKMRSKQGLLTLLCFFLIYTSDAQVNVRDSIISSPFFAATYTIQVPGADLNDRFGLNSNLGFQALWKTKQNWIFGFSGNFLFGSDVKEDSVLAGISTEQGAVLGQDGKYADIRYFERGYTVQSHVGKLFPVIGPNPNSGILIMGGIGFIQHKIRIETIGNTVPHLNKAYKKGYDRLTNGLYLSQFIGYQHFGNRRMINFYAGIDLGQGFTENRRSYNFDTMGPDNTKRLDLFYGAKVGWIVPLYKKRPNDFYVN